MNLYWQNKAPYTHKVKPPKRKERNEEGYIDFLIAKRSAILNYLKEIGVEKPWQR